MQHAEFSAAEYSEWEGVACQNGSVLKWPRYSGGGGGGGGSV